MEISDETRHRILGVMKNYIFLLKRSLELRQKEPMQTALLETELARCGAIAEELDPNDSYGRKL